MATLSESDSALVMDLWVQYGRAFGAGNADGIADLFVDDGDLIGVEGRLASGREAIAEEYRNEFERSLEGLSVRDMDFQAPRLLTPDVCLMNGSWVVDGVPGGSLAVRSTFVACREGEAWRYAAVRFAGARDLE
jgi:uncharacterized protein (TIGR02246 family)